MKGKVTGKSDKTKGIAIDKKWFNAPDVWNYTKHINNGDLVEYTLAPDSKEIVFIRKQPNDFEVPEAQQKREDAKAFMPDTNREILDTEIMEYLEKILNMLGEVMEDITSLKKHFGITKAEE